MRHFVPAVIVAISLLGAATRSAAQEIEVRIKVSPEIGREISRVVHNEVVSDIQREIRHALVEVVPRLPDLAAMIGPALVSVQDRDFRFEQKKSETKTVPLGANGALDLDTFGGNITVTAGGGRDASIEIVKTSRGRTEADAKAGLDRLIVDIEPRGNRVSVRSRYSEPQERRSPFRVHAAFNIVAPAGTDLVIKTLGGNILVKGIRGQVSADTAGGNIDISGGAQISQAKTLGGNITLTEVSSDGTLNAETFGGNVTIQGAKARRLSGSTTGGNVTARDVACESAELTSLGGSVEYSGSLARNGRYTLHSTGGDVRFYPMGNVGFELDASTFAGEIRTELEMKTIGPASTNRINIKRTLHATYGDGSAVVKATTMSGNVTVGKKQ